MLQSLLRVPEFRRLSSLFLFLQFAVFRTVPAAETLSPDSTATQNTASTKVAEDAAPGTAASADIVSVGTLRMVNAPISVVLDLYKHLTHAELVFQSGLRTEGMRVTVESDTPLSAAEGKALIEDAMRKQCGISLRGLDAQRIAVERFHQNRAPARAEKTLQISVRAIDDSGDLPVNRFEVWLDERRGLGARFVSRTESAVADIAYPGDELDRYSLEVYADGYGDATTPPAKASDGPRDFLVRLKRTPTSMVSPDDFRGGLVEVAIRAIELGSDWHREIRTLIDPTATPQELLPGDPRRIEKTRAIWVDTLRATGAEGWLDVSYRQGDQAQTTFSVRIERFPTVEGARRQWQLRARDRSLAPFDGSQTNEIIYVPKGRKFAGDVVAAEPSISLTRGRFIVSTSPALPETADFGHKLARQTLQRVPAE